MVVTEDDGDDEDQGRTNSAEKVAFEYLRKQEYTEVTVPEGTALSVPDSNTPDQDVTKSDVDNEHNCNLRSHTQPPYSSGHLVETSTFFNSARLLPLNLYQFAAL
ncbi:unnamed protein product [Agarophyton chilense]